MVSQQFIDLTVDSQLVPRAKAGRAAAVGFPVQEEDSRGRASLAESIKTPEEKTDEAVLAKSRSWGFLKEAEAGFPVKEVCRQMVS